MLDWMMLFWNRPHGELRQSRMTTRPLRAESASFLAAIRRFIPLETGRLASVIPTNWERRCCPSGTSELRQSANITSIFERLCLLSQKTYWRLQFSSSTPLFSPSPILRGSGIKERIWKATTSEPTNINSHGNRTVHNLRSSRMFPRIGWQSVLSSPHF